jgi:carboxyl-terminal processing protease
MRRRIVVAGLFVMLFGLGWWAGRGRASNALYSRLDIFIEIIHKVEDNYVERVDAARMMAGAVHGMLRDLDPWSEFLDERALADRRAAGSADIGVTLGERDGTTRVIAPRPGSPADRAGVRAGDRLLQVDGKSTSGWTVAETEVRLRGASGSRVRLSIFRDGDEAPRDLTVERAAVPPAAAPESFVAEHGIAYVRVSAIDEGTAAALKAQLRRLGGGGVSALALDLRGCASGSARAGADIAQLFLARGTTLAIERGRVRGASRSLLATESGAFAEWPVAVLVDGGSAAAAEIVAGALQDLDRALLVGQPTFGLASEQSEFPLGADAGVLRLTTSEIETPSGRPIERHSQLADDESDTPPDSAAADSASRRAYHTRSGRIVHGGGIEPDLALAPDSSLAGRTLAARHAIDTATLNADPVVVRALDALRHARAPHDVFAAQPPVNAAERTH